VKSKERFLAALNLSRVDKIPLFEFLDSQALIKSIKGALIRYPKLRRCLSRVLLEK